ncbi:uncharacterized protein cubi_00099 [Cryptosporidium ubiquitum]|uniref:Uncharacterized protein n=1 Tax=Cryptosporidium ubiquitum TaxID=857276 RepID=A0A1J4MJV4_9CRYT|nr:uncharacterized protein cubi_00099 [Cryptosporidium ubiquitum]OII74546.1 hypothetical protein cubi_00099 [Cryptosporidium ubiquitum]
MEYKNKKFIVFPNTNTDLERKLKIVILPNPYVNVLCEYLFDSNHNEVYEIQEMAERSNGITPSAFFGNDCISKLEFCGAMNIDTFFFLLSALAFARNKQYINKELSQIVSYYISNLKLELEQSDLDLFDQAEANIRELFQEFLSDTKLIEKIKKVCDILQEGNEPPNGKNYSTKLTLNDEKLLDYLSGRIIKAAKIASERDLVFKEYYNDSEIISPQASLSQVPAQEIACDLLFACIPKVLSNVRERLKRRFGEFKTKNELGNTEKNSITLSKHPKNQYIGVKKGIKRNPPVITKPTSSKRALPHKSSKLMVNNDISNGNILHFLKKKKTE